jgi:hypothetical protein
VKKGVLDPNPLGGLPEIRGGSLGGLLDIALHPTSIRMSALSSTT